MTAGWRRAQRPGQRALTTCFSETFSVPYTGDLPEAPALNAPGLSSFSVSPDRVAQLLQELSPHKACDPDGFSARILHEFADEFAVPLDIICRLSVRSGVFPSRRSTSFWSSKKALKSFLTTTDQSRCWRFVPKFWRRCCMTAFSLHVYPHFLHLSMVSFQNARV